MMTPAATAIAPARASPKRLKPVAAVKLRFSGFYGRSPADYTIGIDAANLGQPL